MATRLDDIIDQAATYELEVTWNDDDGEPIDLSGYSVTYAIKRDVDEDADLIRLTEADEEVVITAAEGRINVTLSGEQTAALPAGRWPHDMLIVDGDGRSTRLFDGKVTVRPRVA